MNSEKASGGWNELSKAPITSNLVIFFRIQLHSAAECISHGGTEHRSASETCFTWEGSF
jgi:hypothetical protein